MLATLRIKNLALVTDLTLECQPGLNVITGETGAGKSILIGALTLVLGERADRTLIRHGADSCSVEALFDMHRLNLPLAGFLEEHGLEPCQDHQLVLKRSFSATGTNRQFINGSPTTLTHLKSLGDWLVDIHGPHDHQSLLHPARQLDILDAFGNLHKLRNQFAELLHQRSDLQAEKAALIVDDATYAQQLDLLRFQSREIADARLDPTEESRLEEDHHRAANAARLLLLAQTGLSLFEDDDQSILNQSGALGRALQELQRVDPSATAMCERHQALTEALRELQSELSHYADRIDLDPDRLRELEERLNLFQTLKRKYGPSLPEVIRFGEIAQEKLQTLEQRDTQLEHLNAQLQKLHKELGHVGRELSEERRGLIPKLCRAAMRELAGLGFQQSRFDIAIHSLSGVCDPASEIPASGLDRVEFQFAPNPGEPPRPLRAIASSGEMARVMLALKTVLAAQDEVPVLVFDEVDANVGGETARVVGEKMLQIAAQRQVFCVTHLAPVAACARAHYLVSKQVRQGRTTSEIQLLDRSNRVDELARMLGGPAAASKKLAQTMLD